MGGNGLRSCRLSFNWSRKFLKPAEFRRSSFVYVPEEFIDIIV
jgi:hypothetical protein